MLDLLDLKVAKTVRITNVNLRRFYIFLLCTVWIMMFMKLLILHEAYEHIVVSDKAWVYLNEFGYDADPAYLNEALHGPACDPRQLQKYQYMGDGNHSCMPICELGLANTTCFQATSLRLYDGRDIAWFPTHYHRDLKLSENNTRDPNVDVTANFILPYVDRMGFAMELTWDLGSELENYDLTGTSTIWRPGEKELAAIGDWADNILLIVIESGEVSEPRKLLEFRPGADEYIINFTVPEILELAGRADALDTAQTALAKDGEEAPLGRVSGVEILLDIQCSNSKLRVVPASITLDAHDWDKHFCVMTAKVLERWTYKWDTDITMPMTIYNLYNGVRIGTRVHVTLDVLSLSAIYLWSIAAIVILQWPSRVVVFFMEHFLGRWSKIYHQAVEERFSVIRAVSGMATRLMIHAYILEQLKMGEPEITKKTISAYIARALETRNHCLEDEERTHVSEFVYNAMVHYRRHDEKTYAENIRAFFCDFCIDGLWAHNTSSPTATVSQEQCLNALSTDETIQFDQFCALFDRDRELTIGERFVYPREMRTIVWWGHDKKAAKASEELKPVAVVSPPDATAGGIAPRTLGRIGVERHEPQSEPPAEPSAEPTPGQEGLVSPRASHDILEQLREEMAQQANLFRKELVGQAEFFRRQIQGLREEVSEHRATDLDQFAALSRACDELRHDVSELLPPERPNGRNGNAVPGAVAAEAGTPGSAAELGRQAATRDAGARSREARKTRDGALALGRAGSTGSMPRAAGRGPGQQQALTHRHSSRGRLVEDPAETAVWEMSTFPAPVVFKPFGGASSSRAAPSPQVPVSDDVAELSSLWPQPKEPKRTVSWELATFPSNGTGEGGNTPRLHALDTEAVSTPASTWRNEIRMASLWRTTSKLMRRVSDLEVMMNTSVATMLAQRNEVVPQELPQSGRSNSTGQRRSPRPLR